MSKVALAATALVILVASFYLKQAFIGVIITCVLLIVAASERGPAPAAAPAGGVKVQPIIVKRKYVGPASVYPEKITIYAPPAAQWPTDWWNYGPKQVGGAVGTGVRRLKDLLNE